MSLYPRRGRPVKYSELSEDTLGSASEEESILRHTVIVANTADKREEKRRNTVG